MVYLLSSDGKPLMPTKRFGKVRRLLKAGLAKVISSKPFTVKLLYPTTTFLQSVTLALDSGYKNIGISALTEKEELFSAEVKMLAGHSQRLAERGSYRRQRRSRLRYRKPRFDNRTRASHTLAPSIEDKLSTHKRLVAKVSSFLPITKVVIEVASFDIQKLKDETINGKDYQQGEQAGFHNLRAYIMHRDEHGCQNPDCRNKEKENILQLHHIGYWRADNSDRPASLITLCNHCHKPENHLPGGLLYGWQPKVKSYRPETFMSSVRWRMVSELKCEHTYGYLTKKKRVELKMEKSHANDAFVIGGGERQSRQGVRLIEQVRRNNRSLERFYDALYIDRRNGNRAKGQELNSGRRTRNRNLKSENLHSYRGKKLRAGRRSVRKKRYPIQPKDRVMYNKNKYEVAGIQNYGEYIKLVGLTKPVKTAAVRLLYYGKGLLFL
jgi:hypothetical protein